MKGRNVWREGAGRMGRKKAGREEEREGRGIKYKKIFDDYSYHSWSIPVKSL